MSTADLGELRAFVQRLHRDNGEPSTREIARRLDGAISHTTVAKILKCDKPPGWEQFEGVVEALGGDPDEARQVWVAFRDATAPLSEVQSTATGSRRNTPWMMPALNRRPIDRPDLTAQMLRVLTSGTGTTVGITTAVHGAGGFGKTTLTSYVCSRPELRELFPGGLLWITVGQDRQGPDLASAVNDLCEQLTGARPAFTDPEQAGHRLGELLDDGPATLLVVDDVWDDNQLRPFLIGGRRCTRLITTRIPGLIPDDAEFVHVDQMEQRESETLLGAGLPKLPSQQVRRLLELTGRWPLLMALLNGTLRRAVRDGNDLLSAVNWLVGRLSTEGPAALDIRVTKGRDRAVHATVQASVAMLTEADRERYRELAIFNEDVDVPLEALETLWSSTGQYSAVDSMRLVADLVDLSLVAAYQQASQSIRLHDVLRLYLRHEVGAERLHELNALFLDANRAPMLGRWWSLPENDYLWQHLTYHLEESGQTAELNALVTDLRWTVAKSQRYDVAAVEADLARSDTPMAAELKGALAREAHVLQRITPKHAYPAVLISRLSGTPALAQIVSDYESTLYRSQPWLENRWPLPGQSSALIRVFAGSDHALTGCSISPDSDAAWIATTGFGETVDIWNRTTGQRLFQLRGHQDAVTKCAFAPDGLTLLSVGVDGTGRIWDVVTRKLRTTLSGHAGAVNGCTITPDGTEVVTFGDDRTARRWRADDGTLLSVFEDHSERLLAGGIAPDGSWIVATAADGSVTCWSVASGERLHKIRAHIGGALACAVAPDGSWFATGGEDSAVRIWDTETFRMLAELRDHQGRVNAVAVDPSGEVLASCGDDRAVRLWDPHHSHRLAVLSGHNYFVSDCTFSQDGTSLLTASRDRSARLWKRGATETVAEASTTRRRLVACASDIHSGRVLTGGRDGMVQIWAASGELLHEVAGHKGPITAAAVTSAGDIGATAGWDGSVRLWDMQTGNERANLHIDGAKFESCAFSRDGKSIVAGAHDGCLTRWDVVTTETKQVIPGHGNWVSGCTFSPDDAVLATTSWDRTALLWSMPRGLKQHHLTGHLGEVLCCSFANSGNRLITGSDDTTARVWDLSGAAEPLILRGHESAITGCDLNRLGNLLVTCGNDATIRVWDWMRAENVATIRVASTLSDVCWADGRSTICAVGEAGIHMFSFRQVDSGGALREPTGRGVATVRPTD
ncbi:hypothetical protein GCM10010168_10700 [Actinoplanes ianthinogenes]|uniref:NB-ARC domain-containing protein n=1 Tax=Actinoplanes ianthinogenes TaxID=122358 RepID=A0ABM7LY65_9ACTN|nr:NB-ARC domain-containing protein [Actinoplanes ianthinogenes]BCJ44257.1 hypothetical protein Aiant_49140 [Actinoplanes ianthinogenes]GGQ96856.1 hypothetical protein GCM10010168_10700 [Actinoplanes ianthinogenes]